MGVQVVQRWIVAALRKRKFFSLTEVNQAIAELLVRVNQQPFRKTRGQANEPGPDVGTAQGPLNRVLAHLKQRNTKTAGGYGRAGRFERPTRCAQGSEIGSKRSIGFREFQMVTTIRGICFRSTSKFVGWDGWGSDTVLAQ